MVFAHLTLNRHRPVGREELFDVLWPEQAPADPAETLSALLSRLRRALGTGVVDGRRELRLVLPDGAAVDVERAVSATEQGETALASGDASAALGSARVALAILGGEFMSGDELPWVEERRRELAEFRLRALELEVAAGIASGPSELSAAERAARTLVASAPFRESGHRLLMEVLAARGDAAEALQGLRRPARAAARGARHRTRAGGAGGARAPARRRARPRPGAGGSRRAHTARRGTQAS